MIAFSGLMKAADLPSFSEEFCQTHGIALGRDLVWQAAHSVGGRRMAVDPGTEAEYADDPAMVDPADWYWVGYPASAVVEAEWVSATSGTTITVTRRADGDFDLVLEMPDDLGYVSGYANGLGIILVAGTMTITGGTLKCQAEVIEAASRRYVEVAQPDLEARVVVSSAGRRPS